MSVPSPSVQVQGIGAVSADQLNSYVQVCTTYQQMRGIVGVGNMVIMALGTFAPNDGGQGSFYWNSTSVASDDNSTVIIPAGATQGAWLRLTGV